MHRLEKYICILNGVICSKFFWFAYKISGLNSAIAVAGLYKPAALSLQHNVIFTSLTGSLVITKQQLHGKRQKRTLSLTALLSKKNVWRFIDKVVHEMLPKISDFKTPKFKKPYVNNYTLRLRQKIGPLIDFGEIISQTMFDRNKGVFLPLSLHINANSDLPLSEVNCHFLRMLRLPVTLYVKTPPAAFDDPVVFSKN